jgi:hypothetical protein
VLGKSAMSVSSGASCPETKAQHRREEVPVVALIEMTERPDDHRAVDETIGGDEFARRFNNLRGT